MAKIKFMFFVRNVLSVYVARKDLGKRLVVTDGNISHCIPDNILLRI